MKNIKNCIATFFYCGYSPKAPGTMGTLGAAIAYAILYYFNFTTLPILSICFLLACIGNIWIGDWAEKHFHTKDPKQVVIDEVAGYFLTILFFVPSIILIIAGFVLFRLFDITKPYPIHKLEKLPKGWGILMDDLLAACYAFLVLFILSYFSVPGIKFLY